MRAQNLGIVRELMQPMALVLCILALYGVLYGAFLDPASRLEDRIYEGLARLGLAGVVSAASGLLFAERGERLMATLPVRLFLWAAGLMVLLFVLAWFVETYTPFESHVHY